MLSTEMKRLLSGYLSQDISSKDVTSAITPQKKCTAAIKANENLFLAGVEEVSYLFSSAGVKVKALKKDGRKIRKGNVVLELSGNNRKILEAERVALNLLGRMSGVATLCTEAKKKSRGIRIAVTRKTIPGFQVFDKKAAETAGVWSHRKNLSEMILLKENHLGFFSGIKEALKAARKSGKKTEIEVENKKQALDAAQENPPIIMLDNFSPQQAKRTIKEMRKAGFKGKIELSGGITIKNLSKYTNLGADIISMGELTRNARIMDFNLESSVTV